MGAPPIVALSRHHREFAQAQGKYSSQKRGRDVRPALARGESSFYLSMVRLKCRAPADGLAMGQQADLCPAGDQLLASSGLGQCGVWGIWTGT